MLARTADALGRRVATACCEAGALPFPDDSFDLVFGHAVLHHLPDLEGSFREFLRVLRPGGRIAFCGEPSHYGDRIAEVPKRAAYRGGAGLAGADARRRGRAQRPSPRARGGRSGAGRGRARVHAGQRWRGDARAAGFEGVRVRGEELAASMFGWANRALEATAEPAEVPWLWRQYAYRGYLALQALDRALLEPRLPAAVFYNLLVSARAPSR